MEWIKPDVNINFMGAMRHAGVASGVAVLVGLALLVFPGPKYGIDFKGGTEIQFTLDKPVEIGALRAMVAKAGFASTDLVKIGAADRTFRIRLQAEVAFPEEQVKKITKAVKERFADPGIESVRFNPGGEKITVRAKGELDRAELERLLRAWKLDLRERGTAAAKPTAADKEAPVETVERCVDPVCTSGPVEDHVYEVYLAGISGSFFNRLGAQLAGKNAVRIDEIQWVGPKVGKDFRNAGVKSILFALGMILIYVAFRFDLRFAPGAVLCLVHDVIITAGIFVILRREFALSTIAAFLTIVGYSINDTIVVYDRIRENLAKIRERELKLVINRSINETLARTIMTGLTTVISIQPILFMTRGTIQDFALALTLGVAIGTYSSVYIAAPVSIWVDRLFFQKKARA